MYMSVHVCVRMYVYVCGVCMCTGVCSCEIMCLVACYSDFRLVWWDPDSLREIMICARYGPGNTGDSKTDPWDDPKICTSSCNEDQTVIRIQNHIISCECLFLYYFLIYNYQYYLYVTCIISCDHLIYFTSWLPISLHELSVSIHFNYIAYLSVYRRHFMC